LNLTSFDTSLEKSINRVYSNIEKLKIEDTFYRHDIGKKAFYMKKFSVLIILVFTFLSIFPFNIYVVESEDNEIYSPMLYSFKERAEYDLVYLTLTMNRKY